MKMMMMNVLKLIHSVPLNSSSSRRITKPTAVVMILLLVLSSSTITVKAHTNSNRFPIFNNWWRYNPRKDSDYSTLDRSNSYSSLEEFVLGELQRQNSKLTHRLSSSHHHHATWHLAASSSRGGGSVAIAKRLMTQHSDAAQTLHSSASASSSTVSHSFWTPPPSPSIHTQSPLRIKEDQSPITATSVQESNIAAAIIPSQTLTSTNIPHSNHKEYAKQLKNRNNLNISRKLTHAAFGLFFATLNQLVPKATFIPCMTILTSLTLLMEKVRYKQGFGWINDALHFFLGQSLRKHEMEGKFTGSFYYFLGVTLTSYLFPTPCASLGIVQLALADPAASYFGRLTKNVSWSRIQQGFYGMGRNKGLLGFLLGAIFCVPFNYRILSLAATASSSSSSLSRTLPPLQMGFLSLFLGLAGAFADLLVPSPALIIPLGPAPHFHVDDNFVVPLFAGYACTQVFRMIGWTDIHLAPWLFL